MIYWDTCPECEGTGTVEQETYHSDMISAKDVDCQNCGGCGEIQIEEDDEDDEQENVQ